MRRHVGDHVSIATEDSTTRTVCEEKKEQRRGTEGENLCNFLFFSLLHSTIRLPIKRPVLVWRHSYSSRKHKRELPLLATYTLINKTGFLVGEAIMN